MSKESKKGVRMGLSIISGFKKYLKELSEITGKKYNLNSTVSLFSNKKEVKQYFENELGVDTSDILNKGISASEIDNLSVKNGKLVRGGAKAGKESDGTSLFDLVKQKNDAEKSENSSSDSSNSKDGSVFNDASQTTTGKSILQDSKTKANKAAGDTVADVFNLLMQDEEFTKTLDTDGDGEINDEEMKAFFNTIKGSDENDKVVSLDDILTAAGDISDGKLKTEDIKEEQDKTEDSDSSSGASGASGASGGGGVGGSGGVSGSGGSGSTAAANTQTTDEKTLDNMSSKEIEAELKTKRSDLDSKNKDLNEALEGKSEELQKMQDKIDDSYKDYQKEMEKVDKKLAKEIDAKKQEVDTKEQAIRTQEAQIATDEQAVTDAETKVTDASSQRQNFENIVSELEASKGDSKDLTKSAEIDSKISAAKEQLEKAKTAKTEAENKVKDDNEKKTELETELETLNQEMEELEKQLNDKATDEQKEKLEKLKEEWTKNKEDFETKRTELADKAKTEVKAAQKEVDTYEKALTEAKNRENQKEYGNSDISEDIIEFAKKYLGYNEADGSADEFMKAHGMTSATPWCAGFVDYILENCGDYDKVADWYKNVGNKLYCPDVYASAQSANAVVDASQAQAGDLVLFDWEGDGTKDHIGIVTDVSGGVIRTIEGNTSDQVAQREYNASDGRLKFCRITK